MHNLSARALALLRELAASDTWTFPLADGEVRLVLTTLPSHAVIGIARSPDVLWVLIDVNKPDAHEHLSQLIEHWPLGNEFASVSVDQALLLLTTRLAGL